MDRRTIPDYKHLAGDVLQEMSEKAHDPWTAKRLLLDMHQHAPTRGQCTDGRQMIMGERHTQDGRLPTGRIRSDSCRQYVEACLVYPHNGPFFCFRLFLRAGQCSCCHAAIATSSRWVACVMGNCTLWPSART